MEKEFVPYELAVKLKALGFDKDCFGYYENNVFIVHYNSKQEYELLLNCSAPTFSQAFSFFREKYELEGVIQRAEDFIWYKWAIYQYNENGKKYFADWYEYKTYEEAELECLKKLIEIVEFKSE